jgi:hypothetical protein
VAPDAAEKNASHTNNKDHPSKKRSNRSINQEKRRKCNGGKESSLEGKGENHAVEVMVSE